MHGIETIIKNNQDAGRIIASQQERLEAIIACARRVCDSKLTSEQQREIFNLRRLLDEPAKVRA
jgi:hypothetical protein